MESVKKHTAKEINKIMGNNGHLWQKESFDTTIRDDKHLYHAISYTLNNSVVARYVEHWKRLAGIMGKPQERSFLSSFHSLLFLKCA